MIVRQGLIDYTPEGLSKLPDTTAVLFTGNAFIKNDGGLVMGRGAAKQVRDSYPGIDTILGRAIRRGRGAHPPAPYGIVWIEPNKWILRKTPMMTPDFAVSDGSVPKETMEHYAVRLPRWLGCFQVKYHFRDEADLELISLSGRMLADHASHNPTLQFWMNYPGVGNGRLSREVVDRVLTDCCLPDNVTLFIEE